LPHAAAVFAEAALLSPVFLAAADARRHAAAMTRFRRREAIAVFAFRRVCSVVRICLQALPDTVLFDA